MTIEIAASHKALTDPGPIDFDDSSQLPDFYTTASLGFDLTSLGAKPMEIPGEYGPEMAMCQMNFPLLIASVNAAFRGGIDYIQLNHNFHTRSDSASRSEHRSALLDGVATGEEIAEMIHEGGLNIELPLDPEIGLCAVDGFLQKFSGKRAIALTVHTVEELPLLAKFSQAAAANNLKVILLSNDVEFLAQNAAEVVSLVDAVQISNGSVQQTRALRFKLHKLAAKAGRSVKLIAEIGIVISATLQSANERAALLTELTHQPLFEGMTHAIGTVYDVADQVERIIGIGAADGILFAPASLPTDLASVLKGVVPLLRERAKMEVIPPHSMQ